MSITQNLSFRKSTKRAYVYGNAELDAVYFPKKMVHAIVGAEVAPNHLKLIIGKLEQTSNEVKQEEGENHHA